MTAGYSEDNLCMQAPIRMTNEHLEQSSDLMREVAQIHEELFEEGEGHHHQK